MSQLLESEQLLDVGVDLTSHTTWQGTRKHVMEYRVINSARNGDILPTRRITVIQNGRDWQYNQEAVRLFE